MIYDVDGEWVVNDKSFTFVDDQGRRFDVGVNCKAKIQGWVKIQVDAGVLKLIRSPEEPVAAVAEEAPAPPEPEPPAAKPAKAPAAPKA